MDTRSYSIAHWTLADRSVIVRVNNDTKDGGTLGMITGMMIYPDDDFRAEVVILGRENSVHGCTPAGQCNLVAKFEYNAKRVYQFVKEPDDIAVLREKIREKKAAELKAEVAKLTNESSKLSSEQREAKVSAVADVGSGSGKRIPATRASRLPAAASGESGEAT